jgi:hypothetical protein
MENSKIWIPEKNYFVLLLPSSLTNRMKGLSGIEIFLELYPSLNRERQSREHFVNSSYNNIAPRLSPRDLKSVKNFKISQAKITK